MTTKTHCPQGHEYTKLNSYIDRNGYTHCRKCRLERMRERRKDNVRVGRGINNSSKTHCPKGHPYDDENTITYRKPSGKTARHCRVCARANGVVQNLKRYGLTTDQYLALLDMQDNKCLICHLKFYDETTSPHIDHDHACCSGNSSCGKCIRGLLCQACNVGLGAFKDDPTRLKQAVKYLGLGTITF